MDRLTAGRKRRRNDVVHVQIAFRRARRTDANCLVRDLRMERLAVSLGIDRDRNDAEVAARLYDANCDFAAVRDEYLLKHSLNPALVHDYHALDLGLCGLLVADPCDALRYGHRAAALGEVHFKAQCIARLGHGAELGLVDADTSITRSSQYGILLETAGLNWPKEKEIPDWAVLESVGKKKGIAHNSVDSDRKFLISGKNESEIIQRSNYLIKSRYDD